MLFVGPASTIYCYWNIDVLDRNSVQHYMYNIVPASNPTVAYNTVI